MKLLVVEDEKPMATYLHRGLAEEGFAVDLAATADAANDAIAVYEYDAILLDVMLPGANGFELCRQWRSQGLATPILFVTARDEVASRVRGLEIGGDDYLIKPFSFDELLARVRALVRRSQGRPAVSEMRFGDILIDAHRRRVVRNGHSVPLTAREYQLLEHLARNAGTLVTRTSLWEHVWESGSEPDSNVIDVYIRYLRNKLGRDLIETVRGAGYVLQDEPATGQAG